MRTLSSNRDTHWEDSAKKTEDVLYEAVKHLETVSHNQGVWGKGKPADGGPEERLNEPELRYATRKVAIVERHEARQPRDCKQWIEWYMRHTKSILGAIRYDLDLQGRKLLTTEVKTRCT